MAERSTTDQAAMILRTASARFSKHLGFLRQFAGGQGLLPLAGEHQHGLAPGRGAGLHVAQGIAHAWHGIQTGVEAPCDIFEHPGFGLAAGAIGFGGMRAIEQRVDAPAEWRERLVHLVVDRIQGGHIEQPAPDARLIGRDDDPIPGMIEFGDGLEAARNRLPLVRRLDELIAVLVDDTVAIEND